MFNLWKSFLRTNWVLKKHIVSCHYNHRSNLNNKLFFLYGLKYHYLTITMESILISHLTVMVRQHGHGGPPHLFLSTTSPQNKWQQLGRSFCKDIMEILYCPVTTWHSTWINESSTNLFKKENIICKSHIWPSVSFSNKMGLILIFLLFPPLSPLPSVPAPSDPPYSHYS
jgi:hypothetical protein